MALPDDFHERVAALPKYVPFESDDSMSEDDAMSVEGGTGGGLWYRFCYRLCCEKKLLNAAKSG